MTHLTTTRHEHAPRCAACRNTGWVSQPDQIDWTPDGSPFWHHVAVECLDCPTDPATAPVDSAAVVA